MPSKRIRSTGAACSTTGGGSSGGDLVDIDATVDVGTSGSALGAVTSSSGPLAVGSAGSSLAAGPSTLMQNPPASTQSVVLRSGKTWTNPANATGAPNGIEAAITGAATATAADSFDADLILDGESLGNPGGIRTALVVEVTHRYTPASGLLATSSYTIALLDGAALLGTLFTIVQGGAARAALATDTYDISGLVGARTPAQIAALTLRFRATASLPAVTGGSASWQVDAVRLRMNNQLGVPA